MRILGSGAVFFLAFITISIHLFPGVLAISGPQAHIFESVTADYWPNGSAKTYSPTGSVRVSVPNNGDVLQYVRVNLTETFLSRTDIINQTAYRNVVTSYPTTNSTTSLYVNLTGDTPSTFYNINDDDAAPPINLSVEYKNLHGGGRNIFDEDNLMDSTNYVEMNFSITNPSSTLSLTSVYIIIQFERNTNGGTDSINATETGLYSDSGSASVVDTDSDNYNDRVTWNGNLGTSTTINVTVNATIEELVNYADDTTSMDLDEGTNGPIASKGMNSTWFSSNSLTGITILAKFSKGSIRQGLDMKQNASNDWGVRGFIRNMGGFSVTDGYNLTYNVSEWRIYSIDPNTGAPYQKPNQTGNFDSNSYLTVSDGRIYTNDISRSNNTAWFETGSSTKPYFSSYFNWSVVWDTESNDFNQSYINTTLDLPTFYKIDMVNTKNLVSGVLNPDTGDEPITIEDNTTFVGDTLAPVDFVEIFSQIPANTSDGDFHGYFDINTSSIELWFQNDSATVRLNISVDQEAINVSIQNVSVFGEFNGSINVSVWNITLAQIYGSEDNLSQVIDDSGSSSGRLNMFYTVLSNVSMTTGDSYDFIGNTTMRSLSDTYITETHPLQTVSVTARRLIGYKDLIIYDPTDPTIVNGSIRVEVQGQTIEGIKFLDYVPNGTDFNVTNVTVRFYSGSWTTWTRGVEYNITYNGTVTLSDNSVVSAYEYINGSAQSDNGTFTLDDGEIIEVSYQINITQEGIWELPVEIFALDPNTGEEFRAIAYSFVKVDIPPEAIPFQITEDDYSLAKRIVVGSPVMWVKSFDVYNPNTRPVTGIFETEIFGDAINFYVSYYNDRGERIEEVLREVAGDGRRIAWESKLGPMETRLYEIRIFTPPILEIDRDVEVLEQLENRMVKLKMDIYLKSFAEEDYSNVVMNIPISYYKIIEARDGFGNQLQFTGNKETSTIILGDVSSGNDLMSLTIIYRESYPLVVVTPDRDRYDVNSPVGLEILVINGGEKVDYPYLEIEIYTEDMDVVYANIQKLEKMEPLEKTEFYEKFVIPAQAPSGEYVASVKFREDFVQLASATGNFIVMGPSGGISESLQVLLIIAITGVLLYLSQKRLKEVRRINNKLRGI